MGALEREVSEEEWLDARHRADVLDQILASRLSRPLAVEKAARKLKLSRSRVYELLAAYRSDRTVDCLLKKKRSRNPRLDGQVEAIIRSALEDVWLRKTAPPLQHAVIEIRARCEEVGLKPPAYGTIRKRAGELYRAEEVAKRRSYNEDRTARLKATPQKISAAAPREVYQIDHTLMDISVVDNDGLVVGRPYLSICRDVFTKAVTGYYLSLDPPNSISCALCLIHAILPKDMQLAALGVEADWPMSGVPMRLQTDGGRDFNSAAFTRGCENIRIKLERRHRGNKHTGGVVEREFGAIASMLSALEGKTGRSVVDRDAYPTEARACMRLDEVEEILVRYITGVSNKRVREPDLTSATARWAASARDAAPGDPFELLLNFLPQVQRRIGRVGLALFNDTYYSNDLALMVSNRDCTPAAAVRYDPRDIRQVYVYDPDAGKYVTAGRAHRTSTPYPLWLHRALRQRTRENAGAASSEIAETFREIRAINDAAAKRKKAAARKRERLRVNAARLGSSPSSVSPSPEVPLESPTLPEGHALPMVEDWPLP